MGITALYCGLLLLDAFSASQKITLFADMAKLDNISYLEG